MIRPLPVCLALVAALGAAAPPAAAAEPVAPAALSPRPGWRTIDVALPYAELLPRLRAAVRAEGMAVVAEAGPTEAARARGVRVPGNRVVGVFRNDFAVRALRASLAAMIEAPIRFYVVQTPSGATLAWKTPSHVFAPYMAEGGPALAGLARELDAIFEATAARATAP
ncbi:DUF302 domain-containing protein [Oceanicella actignis]|uniref:DUF302 domain-containing protein n=1 Tax=Oceanicella actignis TaxID=1189325 RepID=UPI0011E741FC|nr:DUF302 domain-containing protein [Oceanicella actignis]TYO91333.1 uncharacterized protein (DUF302 family) [Oceanicella actignis]